MPQRDEYPTVEQFVPQKTVMVLSLSSQTCESETVAIVGNWVIQDRSVCSLFKYCSSLVFC